MNKKLSVPKSLNLKQLAQGLILAVKKVPWWLGNHAFLAVLIACLCAILWGGALFYQYAWSPAESPEDIPVLALTFHQDAYQKLVKILEDRAHNASTLSQKSYPDPFR